MWVIQFRLGASVGRCEGAIALHELLSQGLKIDIGLRGIARLSAYDMSYRIRLLRLPSFAFLMAVYAGQADAPLGDQTPGVVLLDFSKEPEHAVDDLTHLRRRNVGTIAGTAMMGGGAA